ncbi:PREDICTED: uncharacterized protein LOC104786142 [Camelina sativa]|uniref:Uncharacterized protein LOC104786142 n=1 Tax=Camelina sativa TaxID=90675 RepID=A0ABM0Z372_CAMSA|nr:PREDICTED: uncharacterized protein LOC104786142 [Camelina sativa]
MTKSSEESDVRRTKKKINDAYNLAKGFFNHGNNIEALGITEKTISDHGDNESCYVHHELQGDIFFQLAENADDTDFKCVYLFATVAAYSESTHLFPNAFKSSTGYVRSLINLGDLLGVNKFYEKALVKAKRGLLVTQPQDSLREQLQILMNLAADKMDTTVTDMMDVTDAAYMMDASVIATRTTGNQMESTEKDPSFDQLKNFWANLDDKTKKEFLVVDFRKLIDYIENRYNKEGKACFKKCVTILDILRWRCWRCHCCPQVNYCFTDCKMHILDSHVQKYEPSRFSARPKYVDCSLADMICSGGDWKPIDAAKASNLMKDRVKSMSMEEFASVGWCSDWPVAEDAERENILKEFAEVLKSSLPKENRTLSSTLWEWLMDYTEENLELPEVPGWYLAKCSFFKNPQCICFLDLKHLEHVLKYFKQLTTDVRASLVSKVVNQLWENSQVKERIDLEGVTTYNLLLDKRLLYEEELELDKIGTVEHYKSIGIYDDVVPQGDNIVSWIIDCPEIDLEFVSQMAKGLQNREIGLATLRIVCGMVRKKEKYYDKRHKMVTYDKMLGEVKNICDREDNWKNDNQRSTYESALRVTCEELAVKQDDESKCFMAVVRDIFEKQNSPRFEVLENREIMECISRLSTSVQNDVVKEGLLRLRKSLKEKFYLIDSKILVNQSTYKNLIDVFPKLSLVEYRLVVIPLVKKFLQDKLIKMMNGSC